MALDIPRSSPPHPAKSSVEDTLPTLHLPSAARHKVNRFAAWISCASQGEGELPGNGWFLSEERGGEALWVGAKTSQVSRLSPLADNRQYSYKSVFCRARQPPEELKSTCDTRVTSKAEISRYCRRLHYPQRGGSQKEDDK